MRFVFGLLNFGIVFGFWGCEWVSGFI